MAERKVKCKICGKQDTKENMIQVGKRYVCKECYEETGGQSDWDLLFETIKRIYGKEPTPMMYKQLKDYKNEPYNFTDGGINATLCYMYDILELPIKEDCGLGLIVYYYEECKRLYEAISISENSLENSKDVEEVIVTNMDFSARIRLLKQNKKPYSFDEEEESEE